MKDEKEENEDDAIGPIMMNGIFGMPTNQLVSVHDKANATSTNTENERYEPIEIVQKTSKKLKLAYLKNKYPTTYAIIFGICFPVILMLAVAVFFGHFVALADSSTEKKSNEESIVRILYEIETESNRVSLVASVYELCIDKYSSLDNNDVNLKDFIATCTSGEINEITTENKAYWASVYAQRRYEEVTGDWITCNYTNRAISYLTLRYEYTAEGKGRAISHELAKLGAAEGEDCHVNSAAGAWFWFTVMTTIGYGNAVPESHGARAMLYSLGFFSILAFTASIGQAASVFLKLVDKIFKKYEKLKSLEKGVPAALLWFSVLVAWLFIISGLGILYTETRLRQFGVEIPLRDGIWWAYASITTVGFGDVTKPQQYIDWGEIFIGGPLLMSGFVFMGIFLLKLSDLVKKYGRIASRYVPSAETEIY